MRGTDMKICGPGLICTKTAARPWIRLNKSTTRKRRMRRCWISTYIDRNAIHKCSINTHAKPPVFSRADQTPTNYLTGSPHVIRHMSYINYPYTPILCDTMHVPQTCTTINNPWWYLIVFYLFFFNTDTDGCPTSATVQYIIPFL